MSTDARERHTLVFGEVEVGAVVLSDGGLEVNFTDDGVTVASFDESAWDEVVAFVARAWEKNDG
jgi:hypothetical protein